MDIEVRVAVGAGHHMNRCIKLISFTTLLKERKAEGTGHHVNRGIKHYTLGITLLKERMAVGAGHLMNRGIKHSALSSLQQVDWSVALSMQMYMTGDKAVRGGHYLD